MVSEGLSADPTKAKSINPPDVIKVDLLLAAIGAITKGRDLPDISIEGFTELVNSMSGLAEELNSKKEVQKDKKFSPSANAKSSSVKPNKAPKLRKDTIIIYVDTIAGVSPSFEGPWRHYNPPGVNDTIEYKKKKQ